MGEKRETSAELLQIIHVATRECMSILEAESLTSHSVCDVHSDSLLESTVWTGGRRGT